MMPSYRDGWTLSKTNYMLNCPDLGGYKGWWQWLNM